MNKFFTILLVSVVLLSCFGAVEKVEAKRSDALLKLLDEILKKMNAFQADQTSRLAKLSASHQKDVKSSDSELSRLKAAYEKEQDRNDVLRDENQKEQDAGAAAMRKLQQTYEKEKRLIVKIKNMLTHEIGTDKLHPAKSCAEVFQDLTAPSGKYWIVSDGKIAQQRCVRTGSSQVIWSGGCSTSDRGKSGWANVCTDTEDFPSDPKFFRRHANHVEVLVAGLYNIKTSTQTHCVNRCGRNSRILINGGSIDYSHWGNGYDTVTMVNDVTWKLSKGDKVYSSIHGAGSDIWRWKSKKDGEARNRMQIAYLGSSEDQPFFSGGCKSHRRNNGWQRLCLDKIEQNSPVTKQHFDHYADGRMVVKKSGYYRIAASTMQHTNAGHHYMRLVVNGVNREYDFSFNNGWQQTHIDLTYPLNADDTVEIFCHANGGNPYTWHAHSTGGHTGRVQITRVSDLQGDQKVKYVQGGPAGHYRSTGWYQYQLSKVQINAMPTDVVSFNSGGNILVKKNTWLRVNGYAASHTNGNQPRYGKITVNDKIVATTFVQRESQWQSLIMDYTFPAVKGDIVKVYYRSNGGNPYIHAFSSPSGQGVLEVFAL